MIGYALRKIFGSKNERELKLLRPMIQIKKELEKKYAGYARVLMGGGRRWFLPNTTPGSSRAAGSDYQLPAELAEAWGVARGASDPGRDLLADFQQAGFTYAAT